MSLKNFPYDLSDDYKELWNYLFDHPDKFIIAISNEGPNHLFKLRKLLDSEDIGIIDSHMYRTFASNFDYFEKLCKNLKLYWITPEKLNK
jgi:hypothetical protein